ncbi:MAG: response regulator [Magnetococcales bacterium]|nr:response regulator [Magnetococcales bacterium]MBF0155348.1 response regulator [Magnetococcales bacterium]
MKKKILLIEDDWHFRMLFETALLEAGHEIRCAENGKAGIGIASSWLPDLVVMDLEMPVMDGIPTIYVLREKGYGGHIAVLSGNLSDENRVKAREAGASHFFSKPFSDSPQRMVEMVFEQTAVGGKNLPPASMAAISGSGTPPGEPVALLAGAVLETREQTNDHRVHNQYRPVQGPVSGSPKRRSPRASRRSGAKAIVTMVALGGMAFALWFFARQSELFRFKEHQSFGNESESVAPSQKHNEHANSNDNDAVKSVKTGLTKKRLDVFYESGANKYYCDIYLEKRSCNSAQISLNPLENGFDSTENGRLLYRQHCERCHGTTGQGNGVDAINLSVQPGRLSFAGHYVLEKDAYLFWTIAEGGVPIGSPMPAFKSELSEKNIWSLVLLVESFH